jgi:hypothetical protein
MDSHPEDFGNLPGVKGRGRWYYFPSLGSYGVRTSANRFP